jgi:hypothetical protein
MFLELIRFVYPMVSRQPEPLLVGVTMLESLTKQCTEISECLPLLELCRFQSSCVDPALPVALANLWVSIMERHSKSSLIQSLMNPWVSEIISSLDPNGLRILEALVVADPNAAGVLGFLLNTNETAWPNILPLIICCLKSEPVPSHAIDFVSRVINGIYKSKSVNDEYLRLSIKLAGLTISTLDLDQKQSLFQCLLNISRNVLPSQVDIIAPLMLALLLEDPLTIGKLLPAETADQRELVKKITGCRTPRLFSRLLLQLTHP